MTQGEARRDELELLGESWNLGTSRKEKGIMKVRVVKIPRELSS